MNLSSMSDNELRILKKEIENELNKRNSSFNDDKAQNIASTHHATLKYITEEKNNQEEYISQAERLRR